MLVGLTLAAVNACGPAGPEVPPPLAAPSWSLQRAPSGFQRIAEPEPPCRDCLAFDRVVASLRDEQGRDALPNGWRNGVVDGDGNYWVGQGGTLRIFDQRGVFVRDVGHQGQGPYEFQSARPVFADATGNVHIYDLRNARETVVAPDFSLVSTRRTVRAGSEIATLPGGRYVMARSLATPDGTGFPLHVFDGLEIVHSFGIPADAGQERLTRSSSERLVTSDAAGNVLSAERYRYLIEGWTADGARIMGLEGPQLNDRDIPPDPWTEDNPPERAQIFDIKVDDDDRLWILLRQRRESWRDGVREVIQPDGSVVFEPVDETLNGLYRSRIDVIDLNAGTLIASALHDGIFVQLLDRHLVAEFGVSEGGDWRVAIWSVEVVSKANEVPQAP